MADPVYNPFSGEDEILVKDIDGKITVVKPSALPTPAMPSAARPAVQDTESIARDILKEAQVMLSDSVLQKRLLAIIVTYLKGIRDIIETREILMRGAKIGGTELQKDLAEKILKKLEEKGKGLPTLTQKIIEDIPFVSADEKILENSGPFTSIPEYNVRRPKPSLLRPEAKPLSSESPAPLPKPPSRETREKKDILKMIEELPEYTIPTLTQAPAKVVKNETAPPRETAPKIIQEIPVQPKPAPAPEKPQEPKIFPKKDLKLTSPIDELRELNITEFRRLDPDPKKACQKIEEKFHVLEKESFPDMAKGIAAWRQSPVSKEYIAMGQESIFQRTPIEKVIEKRKREGLPSLTLEEFNAIMDLNERIRF